MKFVVALLFAFSLTSHAFDHSHIEFDKILKKHTQMKKDQSLFNYKALKKDSKDFKSYLSSLSKVSRKEFDSWNKADQLAFLINVYNAYTIELIIQNYPVKSIKDLGSFFSSAWKKKFFTLFGNKVHLDHVEHELIRENFNEARIHFAVVCASIGCPNLQNFAFVGPKLEEQFEFATKQFIASSKNSIFLKSKKLSLSKIFKWYGDDFNKKYKSYLHYIAEYITSDQKLHKAIQNGDFEVEWNDYDWNLNEVK